MGLFSLLSKGKQQSASGKSEAPTAYAKEEGKAASTGRRSRKSGEEPADPVLPEKKRARRRLVGVSAMVLAAVIGLPMVMESEPQPLADNIEIQIPSKDKPATHTAVNASTVVSVDAAGQETEAAPGSATEAMSVTAATPVSVKEDKITTPPPVAQEQPASQAEQLTPKSEPVVQKPAAAPEKTEKAVPVRARPDEKPAAAASEKFVLQVAALSTQDKAKELQARLNKAGVRAYTERYVTMDGTGYRVRIGPFSSREEAEKARDRLTPFGLNGFVLPV